MRTHNGEKINGKHPSIAESEREREITHVNRGTISVLACALLNDSTTLQQIQFRTKDGGSFFD